MCMLGMGRYVHVYVEYGEVCTCVFWVWGGMYMCKLSMGRYVHVYVQLGRYVHVYVEYGEVCTCVC